MIASKNGQLPRPKVYIVANDAMESKAVIPTAIHTTTVTEIPAIAAVESSSTSLLPPEIAVMIINKIYKSIMNSSYNQELIRNH